MYQLKTTGTVTFSPGFSLRVALSAPSTVSPHAWVAASGSVPRAEAGPLTAPSAAKSASSALSLGHDALPCAPGAGSERDSEPLQRSATGATAPSVQPVMSRCAPRASAATVLTFVP